MRDLLPAPPLDGPLPAEVARVVDVALPGLVAQLDELRAGTLARAGDTAHEVKDDGTPVTPTDLAVDRRLVSWVADRFPDHDVVSEELDATAGDAAYHWVVDPVDGTSNFAAGLPHWCVSVALCHRGRPVLAVVDAPDLASRWVAVAGRGAHRDGTAVRTRPLATVCDPADKHLPLLSTLGSIARARRGSAVRLNPRVLGSTALDHTLVADGTAAAALSLGPKVWDVAAAALLVVEAGGATLTFGARPALLPLEPGVDYTDRSAPAVSGTSPATARELLAELEPLDGWPRHLMAP